MKFLSNFKSQGYLHKININLPEYVTIKKIGYYKNILAYLAYFWHQCFKKFLNFLNSIVLLKRFLNKLEWSPKNVDSLMARFVEVMAIPNGNTVAKERLTKVKEAFIATTGYL